LLLFKRLPFMVTVAPFLEKLMTGAAAALLVFFCLFLLLFAVTSALGADMSFLGKRNGFYIIYVNTKK